ncbi:MAG: AAA family ATPase, partial [Anaerolineales bacterium]|nr:AAA family ATPase [Anaerolineales bacterium]
VLGTLSLVQSELQQSLAKSEHHEFTLFSMVDMWDQQASIQRAWGGWMLMSNITLIGGVSNVGKSPLLLAMVAGYLRGVWPDGTPVPEEMAGRSVVYVLPEGYGEQTEILAEWGFSRQDLAERVFVAALPTPGAPNEPTYTFKLDQGKGMEALHWYCEQVQPGLIVIDGLRAAMTGEESASGDVDRFYAPIGALTRKFGAATIISHHLTKGSETASRDGLLPSMDWFRGSGHITAIPRSAWIVDQPDPNQMELRRLTLVKSAAGPKGQTMAFRMADPADGLHWEAEAPMPPARSKKETAKRFILHMLRRNGVLTHDELWELSQTEGFEMSKATFRDARVDLSNEGKIVHSAKGVGGDYVVKWALPGPPDPIDYDDVVF